MKKKKQIIQLVGIDYENNMSYVAMSFRGGNATKYFVINGNKQFKSNYAFYNILFQYFREEEGMEDLDYDIQRAYSTISFCCESKYVVEKLNYILNNIYKKDFKESSFIIAKEKSKRMFSDAYKGEEFRGIFTAYEFSEFNKGFKLADLIRDIDAITYEDFVHCSEILLNPSNSYITICGKAADIDCSNIIYEVNNKEEISDVRIIGNGADPYLRRDCHAIKLGRNNINISVVTFDFFEANITNYERKIIVDILGELLGGYKKVAWVDSLDSSIIIATTKLEEQRKKILQLDEKSFNKCKNSLRKKYYELIKNGPKEYAKYTSGLMTIKIAFSEYMNYLEDCTYEVFNELVKLCDYKVTEAQVVFQKGVA